MKNLPYHLPPDFCKTEKKFAQHTYFQILFILFALHLILLYL